MSAYFCTRERIAAKFADFLRGPEGQKLIRGFGAEKYGSPLFFPDVIPQ